MNPIVLQTCIIGGVGLLCGVILAVASRYFATHEDPRIEQLSSLLPGINCGGCGFAGCADYAHAIVVNNAAVDQCAPGGTVTAQRLAAVMMADVPVQERFVALVLCMGNDALAGHVTSYNGVADCIAAELAGGGGKACRYGCMGFGSCVRRCPTGAICVSDGVAIVNPSLCISCRKCIQSCPRHLIKMVPEARVTHILCSSRDRGPDVRKTCSVGCIGCGICVKLSGGQGILLDGNLAVIDYAVPLDNPDILKKCPQHTIVRRPGTIVDASII